MMTNTTTAAAANTNALSFESAMERFLDHAQSLVSDSEGPSYPDNCRTILVAEKGGRKYVRIIRTNEEGTRRSAYCFIRKEDGAILKPASWKGPAKGVRGSIYAEQITGVTPYGCVYFA